MYLLHHSSQPSKKTLKNSWRRKNRRKRDRQGRRRRVYSYTEQYIIIIIQLEGYHYQDSSFVFNIFGFGVSQNRPPRPPIPALSFLSGGLKVPFLKPFLTQWNTSTGYHYASSSSGSKSNLPPVVERCPGIQLMRHALSSLHKLNTYTPTTLPFGAGNLIHYCLLVIAAMILLTVLHS